MINLAPRLKIAKVGNKLNFDQITQFWPNFTILTRFHNLDQISQFCLGQANLCGGATHPSLLVLCRRFFLVKVLFILGIWAYCIRYDICQTFYTNVYPTNMKIYPKNAKIMTCPTRRQFQHINPRKFYQTSLSF